MQVGTGTSVLNRIAIGKIRIFHQKEYKINEEFVEDPIPELDRFEKARVKVQEDQRILYDKAAASAGEESAAIFEFHADMLDDDDLIDSCKTIIVEQKHTAEYAVKQGFANTAQMFHDMDDPYFQARSADVIDVGNAMLDELLGFTSDAGDKDEPCILVAEDLAPSETVKLDKSLLLGMVTREGSSNSHTAILARSMNVPALIQCKQIEEEWDGKMAIIDGYNACIYVDPTEDLLKSLKEKQNEDIRKEALLQELRGKKNTTIDGKTIKVYANIGGPSDVGAVKANDAEGVGLFRSEFVYLNSTSDPTEEQQFQAYKRVVETLAPKLVIIRTCDIGADKTVDYMNLAKEENPALGYRAIRISLTRKDFFKRQLRAILRASAFGNVGVMFPMIISVREVRECKEIMNECRRELENEGQKVGNVQIGIMVETPAAVLCADELAEEVEFFSLGTNDLTQYTCAIDRQNAMLEPFSDTHHPAVLKMIKMTIEAGHRHGCWVGICGELGSDLTLTETFLRMGVDELSVNAKSVLQIRKQIRSIDLSKSAE
ncbi:phosphotransferase system, enzyme I, PtsI [Lachnospiraceae bacterium]|nr:phosphotransferase system, enzyme I, PtsI [Lachnospiraceae bacterium]